MPKLVADDVPLLANLLTGVFPGSDIPSIREKELREALAWVCSRRSLQPKERFIHSESTPTLLNSEIAPRCHDGRALRIRQVAGVENIAGSHESR